MSWNVEDSTPETSPIRSPRPSPIPSPARSETPSSPLPAAWSSNSSSDEGSYEDVKKRRKVYEYFEPKAPPTKDYWKKPVDFEMASHASSPMQRVEPTHEADIFSNNAADLQAATLNQAHQTIDNTAVLDYPSTSLGLLSHEDKFDWNSEMQGISENAENSYSYLDSMRSRISSADSSSDSESSASSSVGDFGSDEIYCASDSSEIAAESSESSVGDFESSEESNAEEAGNGSSDSDSEFVSPQLYEGCPQSVDEAVLELMTLFIQKKMEKIEIGKILKIFLKFMPKFNFMPKTRHTLFQYVEKLCPISQEKVHYYCSVCLYYLGEVERNCNLCESVPHKFYQLSLADQLRNLFENHGVADAIDKYIAERAALPKDGSYRDICDGSEFQRAKVDGQYNLVLQAHSDGISVSKSSNVSLWPFEYIVTNLPPYLRFKYVLINGIWLDTMKPNLNSFLRPFANELKEINKYGVNWRHPRTGAVQTSYITVCSFCADAPVRACVQNILNHGGKFCCHICEQKMKKLPAQPVVPGEKKKRRRRVFTFEERPAMLRTAERMAVQGTQTREEQQRSRSHKLVAVKGVKGASVVSSMPGCDISTVVYPEYMHLVLCLLKDFMKLWFESDGPGNLKSHRDWINTFLDNIRVPDFITRIPRSTDFYSKWKAHELRAFLLFFSLVILHECMEETYFQHWLLLVVSMFLLLQETVTQTDIAKASIMLRMFCRIFPQLYGDEAFTYYVHNLLHLPLSCERHGPAWNSAFQYESFNGTLAKFIHGSKDQGKEIINSVKLAFGVEILRARCQQVSFNQANQFPELRNQVKGFKVTAEEKLLFTSDPDLCDENIEVYYRAVMGRVTFTSSIYQRQRRRNNFTVCFTTSTGEKKYGAIRYFCKSGNEQRAVVRCFRIEHCKIFQHAATGMVIKHVIPVAETEEVVLIPLHGILYKVIRVGDYVCLRPNRYEYNL